MRLNRGVFYAERGLTLLEVLIALLISGIFLVIAMRFLTDQWRGARSLKNYLEAHYAVMTSGKTISDVIRTAKTVEWVNNTTVLKVLPMPDETNLVPTLDSYFVDDLDRDGIKDLYWRHLGVSQPVASYITRWECAEVEQGLWDVCLEANVDGQIVTWRGSVRRRTYSPVSQIGAGQWVMSACSSSFF
ncbi:prepilin-type N-terminal cleavage/methylation domain-containing protein [Desulfosporosinus sp. BG]|uniref:prepilin-type N-terminal cleavage/methylation domain-containing protein n=1 Tax=Desulfosporosinus sp. BG TaxID=1633135 RepID=UPI00159F23FE|nr:prepilin-type N-terminal cleavage/methylation domain-containing protein [Desulfosporosinus sp. BG]